MLRQFLGSESQCWGSPHGSGLPWEYVQLIAPPGPELWAADRVWSWLCSFLFPCWPCCRRWKSPCPQVSQAGSLGTPQTGVGKTRCWDHLIHEPCAEATRSLAGPSKETFAFSATWSLSFWNGHPSELQSITENTSNFGRMVCSVRSILTPHPIPQYTLDPS